MERKKRALPFALIAGLAAIGVGAYLLLRKVIATIQSISYVLTVSPGEVFTVSVNWTAGESFTGNLVFYCWNWSKTYIAIAGGNPITTFSPGTRSDSMMATVDPLTPTGSYLVNIQVRKDSTVVAEGWGTSPVVVF